MSIIYMIAAIAAQGGPTYLTCAFVTEGRRTEIQVTADEAAGTVSVFVPVTGNTQRMQGTFTPDRVLFQNNQLSYSLSRVDLRLERTIRMISSTDVGQCTITQPPRRQF